MVTVSVGPAFDDLDGVVDASNDARVQAGEVFRRSFFLSRQIVIQLAVARNAEARTRPSPPATSAGMTSTEAPPSDDSSPAAAYGYPTDLGAPSVR
jgi:hypothetical protein